MPHSPRLHRGKLWLLNSGTGEFGCVKKGRFTPVAFCPGFLRGLPFDGEVAVVDLSRPRYKRFEGLDLDPGLKEADSEPRCNVEVIDLATGACLFWVRIDGAVSELYDVEVIPGVASPKAVAPHPIEAASLITYRKA